MTTRRKPEPKQPTTPAATTQGVQHAVVSLDHLTPHPRNYRRHSESQVARLGASLARFGQVRSVVVQEGADGRYLLVAGHGIAEAARANGYTELRADVIPATWTPQQVEGYLIADNETTRGADDDLVQLAAMLEEQRAAGEHLEALGYSDEELAALLDDLSNAALADGQREVDDPDGGGDDFDTTPEESGPTRVQAGDLWQLGKHRLLCGDSTRAEDVARLMAGETADACITDPPYGINIVKNGTAGNFPGTNAPRLKAIPIAGDDKPFDPTRLLTLAVKVVLWGGNHYASRLPDGSKWLVWDKKDGAFQGSDLGDCELAWTNLDGAARLLHHTWQGMYRKGAGERSARVHPTQKPVDLMAWCCEQSDVSDDGIVLDCYLGSGTTLIACERTGRRCYGIEIEPRYCDVILRRWEAETGREATLLERATTPQEAAHATVTAR